MRLGFTGKTPRHFIQPNTYWRSTKKKALGDRNPAIEGRKLSLYILIALLSSTSLYLPQMGQNDRPNDATKRLQLRVTAGPGLATLQRTSPSPLPIPPPSLLQSTATRSLRSMDLLKQFTKILVRACVRCQMIPVMARKEFLNKQGLLMKQSHLQG